MQMEAIVLSRDDPNALRWLVNPIVRRISKDSLQLSLQRTRIRSKTRDRRCLTTAEAKRS